MYSKIRDESRIVYGTSSYFVSLFAISSPFVVLPCRFGVGISVFTEFSSGLSHPFLSFDGLLSDRTVQESSIPFHSETFAFSISCGNSAQCRIPSERRSNEPHLARFTDFFKFRVPHQPSDNPTPPNPTNQERKPEAASADLFHVGLWLAWKSSPGSVRRSGDCRGFQIRYGG